MAETALPDSLKEMGNLEGLRISGCFFPGKYMKQYLCFFSSISVGRFSVNTKHC